MRVTTLPELPEPVEKKKKKNRKIDSKSLTCIA